MNTEPEVPAEEVQDTPEPEESPAPEDMPQDEGGDSSYEGEDNPFVLTPDADTEITNADGTQIQISNEETNTGGGTEGYSDAPMNNEPQNSDIPQNTAPGSGGGSQGSGDHGDENTAADGTTLYSFNVERGADGAYHQKN